MKKYLYPLKKAFGFEKASPLLQHISILKQSYPQTIRPSSQLVELLKISYPSNYLRPSEPSEMLEIWGGN